MRQQLNVCISVAAMGILLVACGTTREARPQNTVPNDFKVILAERQVTRRHETANRCHNQGVTLPDKYKQKGGGMLEEYVNGHAPCGVSAQERMRNAETDFRAAWRTTVGKPVPREYEWLLAVKGRIAIWLDAGGLTPAEARTVLREAKWVLAGWEEPGNPTAASEEGNPSGRVPQYFASLNTALNQALVSEGIACRKDGKKHPCF
jgi:hypothetical protein